MKRAKPSAFEQDAFSRYWRKRLSYLGRSGVVKQAKRISAKRERRDANDTIRKGDEQ